MTAERPGGLERAKRVGTGLLGVALLVRGFRRRSLPGVATALAGAGLVSRALGDRSPLRRVRNSTARSAQSDVDRRPGTDETSISRSITIGKPAEELYEAWRDPDVFSRVMGHVADVESAGDGRYVWTIGGPLDRSLSWETRVVEEEHGEFLRWETEPNARIRSEGEVRFRPAPGDRGTRVTLRIRVDPPGGRYGTAALERIDVLPEAFVGRALDRFKALVETGTVPSQDGNPSARGMGDLV